MAAPAVLLEAGSEPATDYNEDPFQEIIADKLNLPYALYYLPVLLLTLVSTARSGYCFSSTQENDRSTLSFSDRRFTSTKMRTYLPTNSIQNASTLSFQIPPASPPNMILVNNILIVVGVNLTRANGTTPNKEKFVAPKNNVVHT